MPKFSVIPGLLAISPKMLTTYEAADDAAQAAIRRRAFTLKSASYNAEPTDDLIFFSGGNDSNVTLPTSGLTVGQIITIKNVGAGTPINIFTSGPEYGGNPQLFNVPAPAAAGGIITLVWNGAAWGILDYQS